MAVSNVELRVGATQAITALKNVNTQAQKFNNTVNGTNSKLKDANRALPIIGKGFFGAGAGAKAATLSFKTAGAALATALGPLTAGITLVAALTKTFGNLARADFASARVKTLGVDVEGLTPKLATLSNELSGQVSQLQLLESSYDLASAGFAETAEITEILKAAQLGATGGFSDLQTVTDATTSVLNAYGLEADKAGKIVDGFAQTQADGKIVVDQYAQQIGRIAPIAAGAGVSIDELNAAISAVTATGVPVESTFAGLRQVIASIQKPTGEASKVAEKLGIDFSAAALKSKGLSGVLEEIVAKGGASADNLSKLFGSVEALTAIQPLLNDELVKFNEALENQANAQGRAAQDAFTAANTIQGQLTRIGTAFTNLTTEGSDFGVIIREVLKVTAVTVEALGLAVKAVFLPFRQLFAVIGEIGKVIGEAIGVDATATLFNLEQGWIGIKEAVSDASERAIFFARVVGGVIGVTIRNAANLRNSIIDGFVEATQPVVNFFEGVGKLVAGTAQNIVKFYQRAFEKVVALIPEPLRKLLGGIKLPQVDLDIKFPKFENPFPKIKKSVDQLIPKIVEYSEVEKTVTNEVKEQLDAKNNIVPVTQNIKTGVEQLTEAEKKAKQEAEDLKDTFMEIGKSVEDGVVKGLTDAVMGTKSLAEAATGVLNNLKRKLVEVAMQRAVSGLGNAVGGFLGNVFGGGKKSGGGGIGGFLGGLFRRRASGGPVSAGGAFLVGERGPEILQMGSRGGNIIPNNKIGGGTVNNITINVDSSGMDTQGSTEQGGRQFGELIASVVQSTIIQEQRSGGLLNP